MVQYLYFSILKFPLIRVNSDYLGFDSFLTILHSILSLSIDTIIGFQGSAYPAAGPSATSWASTMSCWSWCPTPSPASCCSRARCHRGHPGTPEIPEKRGKTDEKMVISWDLIGIRWDFIGY